MNLRSKFSDTSSKIKSLEGQAKDKAQAGTGDLMTLHNLAYYSGLRNGVNFVWHILDNHLTENDYDEMEKKILLTDGKLN
jgi:hypothetical protein